MDKTAKDATEAVLTRLFERVHAAMAAGLEAEIREYVGQLEAVACHFASQPDSQPTLDNIYTGIGSVYLALNDFARALATLLQVESKSAECLKMIAAARFAQDAANSGPGRVLH